MGSTNTLIQFPFRHIDINNTIIACKQAVHWSHWSVGGMKKAKILPHLFPKLVCQSVTIKSKLTKGNPILIANFLNCNVSVVLYQEKGLGLKHCLQVGYKWGTYFCQVEVLKKSALHFRVLLDTCVLTYHF